MGYKSVTLKKNLVAIVSCFLILLIASCSSSPGTSSLYKTVTDHVAAQKYGYTECRDMGFKTEDLCNEFTYKGKCTRCGGDNDCWIPGKGGGSRGDPFDGGRPTSGCCPNEPRGDLTTCWEPSLPERFRNGLTCGGNGHVNEDECKNSQCIKNDCIDGTCIDGGCKEGTSCNNGKCIKDSCIDGDCLKGAPCKQGTLCLGGMCVKEKEAIDPACSIKCSYCGGHNDCWIPGGGGHRCPK